MLVHRSFAVKTKLYGVTDPLFTQNLGAARLGEKPPPWPYLRPVGKNLKQSQSVALYVHICMLNLSVTNSVSQRTRI